MRFIIPRAWLYAYSRDLLREAGVKSGTIDDELENLVYEAGERGWDDDDDFFIIFVDDDDLVTEV